MLKKCLSVLFCLLIVIGCVVTASATVYTKHPDGSVTVDMKIIGRKGCDLYPTANENSELVTHLVVGREMTGSAKYIDDFGQTWVEVVCGSNQGWICYDRDTVVVLEDSTKYIYTTEETYAYTEPEGDDKITIPAGTKLEYSYADVNVDWKQIKYKGKTGYIYVAETYKDTDTFARKYDGILKCLENINFEHNGEKMCFNKGTRIPYTYVFKDDYFENHGAKVFGCIFEYNGEEIWLTFEEGEVYEIEFDGNDFSEYEYLYVLEKISDLYEDPEPATELETFNMPDSGVGVLVEGETEAETETEKMTYAMPEDISSNNDAFIENIKSNLPKFIALIVVLISCSIIAVKIIVMLRRPDEENIDEPKEK